MAMGDDVMSTRDAAARLGITTQHLNVLIENGSIVRYARGLIDRHSVERYVAAHAGGRTRVWAEHTAWGAIAMLSGRKAPWLGGVQASRLRSTLREIAENGDVVDLVTRLRDRATVTTYSGHRSVAERLREHVINPGRARIGLVNDDDVVDGYLEAEELTPLVRRYRLTEDTTGSITLRATGFDIDRIEELARESRVLAAVDAATSVHPRERGVGNRALTEVLARFPR
jgi:hypothetical protein